MGYTHYIKNKPAFTDAQWSAFCADVRKLFKSTTVRLAGPDGINGTKPTFTNQGIAFNGVDDDSYVTASVSKDACSFDSCMTAHKPYDSVVVAFYKLIRTYLPTTELSSDGGDGVFEEDDSKLYDVADYDKIVVDNLLTYSSGGFWNSGYVKAILGHLPKTPETKPLTTPKKRSHKKQTLKVKLINLLELHCSNAVDKSVLSDKILALVGDYIKNS